jgi:hypothetical protein
LWLDVESGRPRKGVRVLYVNFLERSAAASPLCNAETRRSALSDVTQTAVTDVTVGMSTAADITDSSRISFIRKSRTVFRPGFLDLSFLSTNIILQLFDATLFPLFPNI